MHRRRHNLVLQLVKVESYLFACCLLIIIIIYSPNGVLVLLLYVSESFDPSIKS